MSAVRGTFADFKTVKTRGVCQLIIEVPIEAADHALAVLGGVPQAKAEQWVGIAPVAAPDAPEAPTETERPSTADWSEAKRKMVQRAALVCKEPGFQRWVISLYPTKNLAPSEGMAKQHVCYFCDVKSRADIDPEKISGGYFKTLMLKYEASEHGTTPEAQEQQMMEGRR